MSTKKTTNETKGLLITRWASKVALAGILTIMGWMPKLVMAAESEPLAEKLADYGGRGAVTGIGVMEAVAVILILIPKTAVFGAGLGVALMLGAIGSHVSGIVGFGGEDGMFTIMFVVALVALALSATAGGLEFRKFRGGSAPDTSA